MNTQPDPIRYPFPEPPSGPAVVEIADGILWARLPLPMKLDHVNVYILRDGDGWTVVDTGFDSKTTRKIWRSLMEGPMDNLPVWRVIVTHHHPDHVGLAGWMQSEFGAELWTTRTAWLFSRMLMLDKHEVQKPETLAHYRAGGMATDIYEQRCKEKPFNFADVVAPMPLGFRRIKQDDCVLIGGREWDVHIGNGHAPEHATFWSRDGNLVLAGDQIIPSISPNIGVYATEPAADPVTEWLESCNRLATLAREDHFVLPGHKLPFTGLPARMTQLIENHHGALDRLVSHLETPKTASECFMPLFKRQIGGDEYGLALVESIAHLNHLLQAGRVTRTMGNSGAWIWQSV